MTTFPGDFYRLADELAREMAAVRLRWVAAIERQMEAWDGGPYIPPAGMDEIEMTSRLFSPTQYRITFSSGDEVEFSVFDYPFQPVEAAQ